MSDFFLNPWAMAAGALLVSSPVIIHLINRLRYRRVRWAAMEFLLKAQKRLKRKLILQQLILLSLRCLIVLLLGLLVGRFLGFGGSGEENRATAHIILLDDTPSMADGWRGEDGATTDAFEEAKKVAVEQIARSAAEATTAQTVEVVRLSDLKTPRSFGRLNAQAIDEMKSYLAGFRPTNVRVPLPDGLKKAQELLAAQGGDVNKVVHVVSDFRASDWNEDGDAVKQVVSELTGSKVKVYLVDVAHPYRQKDDRRAPMAHDNLAITELSPAKLVVARYDPLEFTLRVRNNGAAEMTNVRFDVKVNGDDNKGRSVEIPSLPGFQERAVKFELPMDRVGTEDQPLNRFSLVTAVLATGEPGGLTADNVRHALVEVRERLPILIVEGRPEARDSKDGDGFYLRPVFTQVLSGFGWQNATKDEVEKLDLGRYSFVMLLNVPSLSDAAVKNLEQYVAGGGGVGFFLGPNVLAKEYNQKLYRNGAGLFPVPLADAPSPELTEEQRKAREDRPPWQRRSLMVRDPARRAHPALAGVYLDEAGQLSQDGRILDMDGRFVNVYRHWPIPAIGPWRTDRSVVELYCLPNESSMADYEQAIRKVADALPVQDPRAESVKDVLPAIQSDLRRLAASSDPLYLVANALDDLLGALPDPATAARLRAFWDDPRSAALKAEVVRLRDAVKFGPPLYLAKEFGRGRVTLVTTTAGEQWTDWPSQQPGARTYTPVIKEMATYLAGGGAEANRLVGQPIELRLDTARYKPTARRAFITHDPAKVKPGGVPDPNAAPITDLKEQALTVEGDQLVLRFNEATNPGGYLFTLTNLRPQGSAESAEVPEYRGFAANLDAAREGDLRRATRDDVTVTAPGASLQSPADTAWLKELQNKKSDFSETVWPVLLLFLCLIAEQVLATALSYHAASGELDSTAPSAAAAMRKSTHAPAEEAEPSAAA